MNYNLATLKLFSNFLTCNLPDQRLREDIKKKNAERVKIASFTLPLPPLLKE